MRPARTGELRRDHRDRVREILDATAVFRPEEIDVALELFDDAIGSRAAAARESDYETIGLFGEGDRVDGYACFGPTPGTDRTFDLYWIAVDPRRQDGGGGSQLLAAVERALGARQARLLVAETSSRGEYAATRAFYDRRGFAEAARSRDYYARGDDRVIYVKRLAPPRGAGARS